MTVFAMFASFVINWIPKKTSDKIVAAAENWWKVVTQSCSNNGFSSSWAFQIHWSNRNLHQAQEDWHKPYCQVASQRQLLPTLHKGQLHGEDTNMYWTRWDSLCILDDVVYSLWKPNGRQILAAATPKEADVVVAHFCMFLCMCCCFVACVHIHVQRN